MQSSKFELVINNQTARLLGLTVRPRCSPPPTVKVITLLGGAAAAVSGRSSQRCLWLGISATTAVMHFL